mgnify:CR=1 FL=1
MTVLTRVFGEGAGSGMIEEFDDDDMWGGFWTPAEKAIIRKLPAVGERWLDTTEDRRGK